MPKYCNKSTQCPWGDALYKDRCAYKENMNEEDVCPRLIDEWDAAPAETLGHMIAKQRVCQLIEADEARLIARNKNEHDRIEYENKLLEALEILIEDGYKEGCFQISYKLGPREAIDHRQSITDVLTLIKAKGYDTKVTNSERIVVSWGDESDA